MKLISADNIRPVEDVIPEEYKHNGVYTQSFSFTYTDPLHILCHLIIDDGNYNRQNRLNLFKQNYTHIGISLSLHDKIKCVCVITFYGDIYKQLDFVD